MLDERKENRRLRLVYLMDTEYMGKQSLLAEATGLIPNLISRYIRGVKGIGEDIRDKIEDACRKPRGWMDIPLSGETEGVAAMAASQKGGETAVVAPPTVDVKIAHASTAVVSILRAAGLNDLCFGDIKTIKAIMKNGPQETFTFEEILRAALRVFMEKRELIADLSKEEFAEVLLAYLHAERDVIRRTKKE